LNFEKETTKTVFERKIKTEEENPMILRSATLLFAALVFLLGGANPCSGIENGTVLYATKIYSNRELTTEDASWIASHADLLVTDGSGDAFVKQMKSENPDLKVFRYFVSCAVSDGERPSGAVIGYRELSGKHPDWFLTDSGGERIKLNPSRYLIDPRSEGWPEYWLKQVLKVTSALPYDGVHGDVAHTDITRFVPRAKHRFPREEDFHRVQEKFLAALHEGLNRKGKLLILNNFTMGSSTDPYYLLNTRIHNCDGFNQQGVVMKWRNQPEHRFVNEKHLVRTMEIVEESARRQKIVMLGMQPSPDRKEISYCVGCYLLMKSDPWVYLNIDWGGKYEHMRRLFDDYSDIIAADYGVPLGPRYKEDNLWKRKYSRGLVVVDPPKHTFDFVHQTKY